jgi:CRP-like cAMP-binding protein/membrane protein YdbS with pleckstrin-like domain
MALTPEQAAEVWELFGNTPLFSRWPEARSEQIYRLDVRELKAGTTVFQPGDSPECLYLVASGVIRELVRRDNATGGPVWLELRHVAGQYFGQKALFDGNHESSAVVFQDARLYRMGSIELQSAMARNADLRDCLLRGSLASRLRRIPLLRSLEDNDVLWLAQAIEEATYGSSAQFPLRDKLGLWMIEWGHVAVTGSASLYESASGAASGQESQGTTTVAAARPWRLTAGNFFVSPTSDQPVRTPCTAQTAEAKLETRVFYLASENVKRLAGVFGDVRATLSQPLDIANVLMGVRDKEQAQFSVLEALKAAGAIQAYEPRRLFSGQSMRVEHFRHLAQFCGWEFVPADQNITTQGAIGHSLVILRNGEAVISAADNSGRPRPRSTLHPGDYYGQTSLLEGRPRDASIRAVKTQEQRTQAGPGGAEVIVLDRRDLQVAFSERPDLWRAGIPLFDRSIKIRVQKRAYDWQEEEENVLWRDRPHWLFLLIPELGAVVAFALLYALLLLLRTAAQQAGLLPGLKTTAWLLAAWGVTSIILAINYFIDYYVVTNTRVTRRDRQLLVYDVRTEAPIDTVQDVSVAQFLIGRLFGFGDLSVRTAAKVGGVFFPNVRDPDMVQKLILAERTRAVTAARGQEKETLRRQLISGLHVGLPIPERVQALGPGSVHPTQQRWSFHLPHWEWGTPKGYEREPGHVLWRKSWVNLLQRAGLPTLILIFLLLVLVVGIQNGLFVSGLPRLPGSSLLLAWLVLFVPTAFWLWFQVLDWRNDIYVVTDDVLIDIEAKPLALSYQRREGSLDRVQTAVTEQKGFWANVLDYGTVQILTAAADPGFTFYMVGHPKRVQAVIFQKLDGFRRRREAERTSASQRELIEGLRAYDELQSRR